MNSVITFSDWLNQIPGWLQGFPEFIQKFLFDCYMTFPYKNNWQYFFSGLKVTFEITLGALFLGVIFGVIVAVIRSAHDSKRKRASFGLRLANGICKLYLTVIRGTPMMVQLLIMSFVIMMPRGETEQLICAILTFGINSGAYVAEIVRSGIMSIDRGQMEAGRSLGLNYYRTMRYIIVPQAIKNILPALGNELITLVKETSVVTIIGLRDLTKGAMIVQSKTYVAFVPYVAIALIYLFIVIILSKLLSIFERRLRESDRR